MRVVHENFLKFDGFKKVFVSTTNTVLDQNGCLVMGAGAAKTMADTWYEAPRWAGHKIKHLGPNYGFVIIGSHNEWSSLGIFQVKHHFRDPASLALIEKSAKDLAEYAKLHTTVEIRCNYPGIGLGGLSEDQVRPLLNVCPDNVVFCKYISAFRSPGNLYPLHQPLGPSL